MKKFMRMCIGIMFVGNAIAAPSTLPVTPNGNNAGGNNQECVPVDLPPWEQVGYTDKYLLVFGGDYHRVWEWIPKRNNDYRCILVEGSELANGISCYPLPK